MPISARALQNAALPLDKRVLQFLQSRPTEAFSDLEILAGVEGYDLNALTVAMLFWSSAQRTKAVFPLRGVLKTLQVRGIVLSAMKGGIRYWMAKAGQIAE